MIQWWLWALSISCICPLGRYIIHMHCTIPVEPWNLKHPVSRTSPDTHASPFVYPVIHGRDQHIQHGAVGGAINCASAYWVERIAGHAVCSRHPLWQTCTVIHVCKVRRYFNIRWPQSDSVLIFIKAIHTCSSVNNWEWMIPWGRSLLQEHTLWVQQYSPCVLCRIGNEEIICIATLYCK